MTAPAERTVARKSVAAASFGNAMEWYDFSVYAFFASYVAANFFPSGDPTAALLGAFLVFGAGFVARPLGAVVIGMFGDRRGRKAALVLSIAAMGLGTLILAAAPPFAVIGVGAPILLLIGRLLQGFSAGGEIGGAAAFMIEHSPADRRARYAAWLQASMGISNLMSAVVGLAITTLLPREAVAEWAWRIPFVLGLLIIPVGLYTRRRLPEPEVFERERDRSGGWLSPLRTLFAEHPGALGAGFLFSVLWTVAVYALVIYPTTYYKDPAVGLRFTDQQAFLATVVGNVVLIAGCLVSGRLADARGARWVIVAGSAALLVVPLPGLLLLHAAPSTAVLVLVQVVLSATVSVFVGAAPATLPMAFPVAVRSTGMSLSYNLAAIFFAGFTPALMTWAVRTLSVYAPAFWVAAGAVASLTATPTLFRHITTVTQPSHHSDSVT
ncbi:MFS transporter [Pseudonocardia eucalypti]|uniref:MFS transporter n=1 Tax=Pseudonocardia eucalypti TaxID=648755 RepID=A0ABP9Q5Q9_9PSEU|nr:MHS family proline/betaine transporter-like MFS transporter [Pseudonocardia eucalypti]